MEFLEGLLQALIIPLRFVLEAIVPLTGSYGLAIMVLSLIVSTLLSPIATLARRMEQKDKLRQEQMAPLIDEIRKNYKGQERFERTDQIYQQFGYHPIKSMASLLPLFVQLPFLLAALFLLIDYPPLQGEHFLFIRDLGKPDGLLSLPNASWSINLLPVALTLVAILESVMRPEATRQSQRRFLIVAIVLLVLIYPFPAAVCLYWLTSNLVSFGRSLVARRSSSV